MGPRTRYAGVVVKKGASTFRRLCRWVFNRWTLTIVTLALVMESIPSAPSPLRLLTIESRYLYFGESLWEWLQPDPSLEISFTPGSLPAHASPDVNTTLRFPDVRYIMDQTTFSWSGSSWLLPDIYVGAMSGSFAAHVDVPLSPFAFLLILWTGFLHGRAWARRAMHPGVCRKCGYPTASLAADPAKPNTVTCPECGTLNAKV
jgi:hypothetical protein